jgi:hypothetical protein
MTVQQHPTNLSKMVRQVCGMTCSIEHCTYNIFVFVLAQDNASDEKAIVCAEHNHTTKMDSGM